jgi:uncharacterized protein
MPPSLSSMPVASANARPVDESERLVLLDTLRGFALCGVFMANVYLWFSGRMFLSRAQYEAALKDASWLDIVANHAFGPLIAGRFITIFSFLFGLGFAVQLGRAEGRGTSIIPVYVRRLVVMLGLGLAHLFLLFQGDIVSTYALMGFTLLLFYKRADRTLLLWAAALIFLGPPLWNLALRLPLLLGSPDAKEAAKAAAEHSMVLRVQVLEAFSRGSWLDTVRSGAAYYFGDLGRNLSTFLPVIVGRFLLGRGRGAAVSSMTRPSTCTSSAGCSGGAWCWASSPAAWGCSSGSSSPGRSSTPGSSRGCRMSWDRCVISGSWAWRRPTCRASRCSSSATRGGGCWGCSRPWATWR